MRLLLLHNIINPHMTPVFEALSRTPGIESTIVFFAEREGDRRWNAGSANTFRSVILPGRQLNLVRAWDTTSIHVNPGLGRYLRATTFDVLINAGWASLSNWQAFVHCRRRHLPHVLWAGSTEHEKSLPRTVTAPAVRYLVRHSDAWVSYGTASARYLEQLGAPHGKVVPAFHCIDNEHFLAQCAAARPAVEGLRATLGLAGKRVVLFVGRMVERKGVPDLLSAFTALRGQTRDLALVLVGEGPLRAEWEALAARLGGDVRFVGHVELDELPRYYLLADVLAVPSLVEVWGLVLNEGALAGLPLVSTSLCGGAVDLIEEGVNGHVVPPSNPAALETALASALANSGRMGEASRRIVERCTPAGVAAALARAARLAVRER